MEREKEAESPQADMLVEQGSNESDAKVSPAQTIQWIKGPRLVLIAMGSGLALFIVQTEASVTSTAILSITNDLGDFFLSYWVFTAYLLTYGGFPIILARLSDIFGRKQSLLACLAIFVIFSGACGGAQSMLQLIMFRWLKGIGASGIVSIVTFYGFELRPPEKWASYGALISFTITISLAVAPLIGAGFAQIGEWRWVFLMNVPIGVMTMVLLLFAMPKRLAIEPAAQKARSSDGSSPETHSIRRGLTRLDFVGALALLGATVLITAALQQAAEQNSFKTAAVLVPLILSPIFLLAFIAWQWVLHSRPNIPITPLLSWPLLTNRIFLSIMLNSWLAGAIMTVTVVQIPQRFVVVNALSPIAAGVRLLPFAAVMAASSVLSSIIVSKAKIPVVNALLFAGLLMVAGTAGLSQVPTGEGVWGAQYGFQVLAGVGVGIVNVLVILLPPYVLERKHLAVANGAVVQMRILGGALGLAITQCASTPSLRRNLARVLTPDQIAAFLDRTDSIRNFSPETQAVVREINGRYYNLQMYVMIGFAGASVLAALMQWQRKPIILKS